MFAHWSVSLQLFLVVLTSVLDVTCYDRWVLSECHKNYFKDWCLINSHPTFLFLTCLNFINYDRVKLNYTTTHHHSLPPTTIHYHPTPSTTTHHHPPPATSQVISTNTHNNPPTVKTFFTRNPLIRIFSHCLTATSET